MHLYHYTIHDNGLTPQCAAFASLALQVDSNSRYGHRVLTNLNDAHHLLPHPVTAKASHTVNCSSIDLFEYSNLETNTRLSGVAWSVEREDAEAGTLTGAQATRGHGAYGNRRQNMRALFQIRVNLTASQSRRATYGFITRGQKA